MDLHAASEGRPYRSHKIPACGACRRRKIRCQVDDPATACRLCRTRGFQCDRSGPKTGSPTARNRGIASGRRVSNVDATASDCMASGTAAGSQGANADCSIPEESSSLMVNQTMAEDVDVLERHLVSNSGNSNPMRPYVRMSNTLGESIIYRTVPRQRKGLQTPSNPGAAQREIMENVLGPHLEALVDLYFDKIHPCFPVFDEASFRSLWKTAPGRISSTLLCDMYAISLLYWNTSEDLSRYRKPDTQFAWNQAVIALRDDYMAPSMTTIHATILDLLGRPVYQVTGNIANTGRMVTLAHSLGLHRDPSTWVTSDTEKRLRIRVWWGVVIHDYWLSLSHGTPPNINRQQYDVPLPTAETVVGTDDREHSGQASSSFVHLCSLTRILGEILPLIYSLHPKFEEMWKSIRRMECDLDDWEDQLPEYLRISVDELATGPVSRGSSGLRFYYLSTRLTLRRLEFKMITHTSKDTPLETRNYHFMLLRKAALTLIEYLTSIEGEQLTNFWLPYTAHLIVSATTTLLRCIIESNNGNDKSKCSKKLLDMLRSLQAARKNHDWDLADSCIETCGPAIETMARAHADPSQPASSTVPMQYGVGADPGIGDHNESQQHDDILNDPTFTLDSLDIPWDSLWDDLSEPWRLMNGLSADYGMTSFAS